MKDPVEEISDEKHRVAVVIEDEALSLLDKDFPLMNT